MGQVLGAIISAIGGPLGVAPAAVANELGIPLSGGLIGDLLGIGGANKEKPAAASVAWKPMQLGSGCFEAGEPWDEIA